MHVNNSLPEEGCGLLGGRAAGVIWRAEIVMPVENILHNSNRYRMEPRSQLRSFKELDRLQLDLIAIFHSHPDGSQYPSTIDIAEFAYPGVLTLILSPSDDFIGWLCRGFRITGSSFYEIPIVVV